MKIAITISSILVLALAAAFVGYLVYRSVERSQIVAGIEQESPTEGVTLVEDIGSTKTLEILPLVENASASPDYQSEHGVSYLIKTDSASILMDLGFNQEGTDPSPLEHNMAQLGVHLQDLNTIVLSHWHPDHTGGTASWQKHTFSFGKKQVALDGKRAFVPSPMTYPGLVPVVASQPTKIGRGVALTGVMPFAEIMNNGALIPILADVTTGLPIVNYEQALAVYVEGRGIVLITGCGHPTVPRLVARAQAAFSAPVTGIVGGLHLGGAPSDVVESDIHLLKNLNVQLVGLSPHDSDLTTIGRFRGAFRDAYKEVEVGRIIRFGAPAQ